MTTYSETFGYVYAVEDDDGKFIIESTKPVATHVKVSDDEAVLRDHDKFKINTKLGDDQHGGHHGHSGADESLTFVSRATDAAGDQGFIAKDSHGDYFFFTQDELSGKHPHQLHEEHGGEHICFMPGTRIKTPSGETPVEMLAIGDLVLTTVGDAVPVRWIGRQTVARLFVDDLRLPVCVKAGALADGVPARDLHLSPEHALFVDGALIQAGSLINGVSIVRSREVPPIFIYYHVEVDGHALILAENAPAETFVDNVDRMGFDNWREREALGLDDATMVEMPYPRAKASRQVSRATRERLAERASALVRAPGVAA
ncbi:Hint domain-containing protein [Methylocapsa sp. S129]|uniref:Hint domain-containing protein n=1 Tax=Methylocapsa sp. S129 TaxID=1641869 RepID=UPI00131E6DC0|nr:Hint domain-containing protein [Methylocapsa sp. S129]